MKDTNKIIELNKKIESVNEYKILDSLNAKNVKLNLKQSVTKINATFTIEITKVPINISKSEKSLIQTFLWSFTNKFMVMPIPDHKINYKKSSKNSDFKDGFVDSNYDEKMASSKQIGLWINVCKGSKKDLMGKSKKATSNMITECLKEINERKKQNGRNKYSKTN